MGIVGTNKIKIVSQENHQLRFRRFKVVNNQCRNSAETVQKQWRNSCDW